MKMKKKQLLRDVESFTSSCDCDSDVEHISKRMGVESKKLRKDDVDVDVNDNKVHDNTRINNMVDKNNNSNDRYSIDNDIENFNNSNNQEYVDYNNNLNDNTSKVNISNSMNQIHTADINNDDNRTKDSSIETQNRSNTTTDNNNFYMAVKSPTGSQNSENTIDINNNIVNDINHNETKDSAIESQNLSDTTTDNSSSNFLTNDFATDIQNIENLINNNNSNTDNNNNNTNNNNNNEMKDSPMETEKCKVVMDFVNNAVHTVATVKDDLLSLREKVHRYFTLVGFYGDVGGLSDYDNRLVTLNNRCGANEQMVSDT